MLDESFVQRVELVLVGKHLLQPEPLRERRLHERSRRVGVVLEHLGRTHAVVREIKSTVQRRWFLFPRGLNQRHHARRDVQLVEQVLVDDMLRGFETHAVQLVRGVFELEHFVHRERVVCALVPVGALGRVPRQADTLDLALPVVANRIHDAFHCPFSHWQDSVSPAVSCFDLIVSTTHDAPPRVIAL